MKYALMVLAVLAVAGVAQADCFACYVGPTPDDPPGCRTFPWQDWCSGDCCTEFAYEGMPCRIPDSLGTCYWLARAAKANRSLIERAVIRPHPADRAFTSRLLLERNGTVTQRRLNTCGARS